MHFWTASLRRRHQSRRSRLRTSTATSVLPTFTVATASLNYVATHRTNTDGQPRPGWSSAPEESSLVSAPSIHQLTLSPPLGSREHGYATAAVPAENPRGTRRLVPLEPRRAVARVGHAVRGRSCCSPIRGSSAKESPQPFMEGFAGAIVGLLRRRVLVAGQQRAERQSLAQFFCRRADISHEQGQLVECQG